MNGVPHDMIIIAADVNGLKVMNDDMGHNYGDELIKGCAEVLSTSVEKGRCFRIGGDEFVAIVENCLLTKQELIGKINSGMKEWHGKLIDRISMSYGIINSSDNPTSNIHDLLKLADKEVMVMKEQYYRRNGVDRRLRQSACDVLFTRYKKILKVNLNTDKYEIVQMNWDEKGANMGFYTHLSSWMRDFALSGQVYECDVDRFLDLTDSEFLKSYFYSGKDSFSLNYLRKADSTYEPVSLEMIAAKDYSSYNRIVYLYVRKITERELLRSVR